MKTSFLLLILVSASLYSCTFNSKSNKIQIEKTEELKDSVQEIKLLFVGDVMQHKTQLNYAKTDSGYNYSSYFKHIRKDIQNVDFSLINFETTLGGKPYSGYPLFSSPDELLLEVLDSGFNIILTANNHILDRGKKGLRRTLSLLDSLRVQHTGSFQSQEERENRNPLWVEKNGIKIAFLNYTYGTNGLTVDSPFIVNYIDKQIIEKDILKAYKNKPDALIMLIHWGEEYEMLPNKKQVELANWLFSKGVHHIIGSHPHVIQPIQMVTDSLSNQKKVVAYSLGNFISNMSRKGTDGGMMLKLTLQKDSITQLKSCEYNLVWTGRPIITGENNYILYPSSTKDYLLNNQANTLRNNFLNTTRKFLNDYNQGAREYLVQ